MRDQMLKIGAFWLETPNNIIFLATTSTIPICTPHSLLEWRESGDHRGMYGVQIRVFFLVPVYWCCHFYFKFSKFGNLWFRARFRANFQHLISQLYM